jgi:acetylornithine deacetylase/succinyl-diaminopimelate desuccinylase-like protein
MCSRSAMARGWTQDPWGGALVERRIYGRGACDMKCGTTASLFTYIYLHELQQKANGRLTLSAVSDEERRSGPGARYLFEHPSGGHRRLLPQWRPSSPWRVRFGEKGLLWLECTVRSNAQAVSGIDPTPVISLGGTDTRLWRYRDLLAIVYGPSPTGMGSTDEHVTVQEFLHVVKCYVLSAYDYMARPG